jgi:Ca2+/Na+ antiporter
MIDETLILIFIVVALGIYVYYSYSLQRIANRTNTDNAWMAWIPILNIVLMCRTARKSLWYFLGMLIPYVNILVLMYIWGEIAGVLGKSKWFGVLTIVPIANLALPGYLAFSE